MCWKTATGKDVEVMRNFISDALVIKLERPIKLKTADIRKAYKIKLSDVIIAATALVYGLVLITRNTSDFLNIQGSQIVNLYYIA